ncbi:MULTISPECIES: DUF6220 domain-containing protein [Agrobacterium]|jgi:hypothetical protein|uniref:DUF6220 domain-containing protein n=1 Tax=Agrobacterium TaxID=357 RepID=UPI00098FF179|nr:MULTISPECIES: DUF6220 domain-containing protein [Agrobacterium]MBA4775771.1 hypothetical protein [Hyphomicrobiales bacterium]PNQ24010.1 hypothetical protein C2E26_10120 [Rhizobium sp. YIC5082]MCZ7856898.1 DUF6220 domain-containing protein [Agrobacterium salinitolerans]MCZ7863050.1 DUF6220 domain-containing protein [Agrobacterium salinitolerans]MCZ7886093.1 DUF6220 domain-containing protein [Agrobacterium salinitolerans]
MATVGIGVSVWRRLFVVISASVPLLIFAQVLLAGLSIYYDGSLISLHKGLGLLISVPILSLVILALRYDELRPNLGRALVLLGLYCFQVALMSIGRETGNGFLQALHVPNAFVMGAFSDFAARQARSPC